MSKPNGTFLLRFSDSEIGGITIAWVAENPNKAGMTSRCVPLRKVAICIHLQHTTLTHYSSLPGIRQVPNQHDKFQPVTVIAPNLRRQFPTSKTRHASEQESQIHFKTPVTFFR